MKIIKEIEKSRLTEDALNELKGGESENMKNGILKKYLALIVLIAQIPIVFAQTSAKIDERLELTTVVLRLTGQNAFTRAPDSKYTADIDSYFFKFKDHELINFVKNTIHSRKVLNLPLPVELAGDIKITSKGIALNDLWSLSVEDSANINEGTWTLKEIKEYVRLLNKFYKETNFHTFYLNQTEFYSEVQDSLNKIVSQIDTSWFMDFFGKSFEMANIWVVPLLGPHNFADMRIGKDGKEYHNCAIGLTHFDSLNAPQFDQKTFMLLIHEICHNYNNPICEKYEEDFLPICDTLLNFVGEYLDYYGQSSSILYEGLNRVCEYSYYMAHNSLTDEYLNRRINSEECSGFVWIDEILKYMEVFHNNRDLFPTYEHFMPQLKLFYEDVVKKMDNYYLPKMKLKEPQVVATFPVKNSIVDTTISKVEIIFSQPMQTGVRFARSVDNTYNALPLPVDFDNIYWLNEYHYVIPLQTPLKPNSRYGLRVPPSIPSKKYGIPTLPYDLIFETK